MLRDVLLLGLVNWIATAIIVESELTRPVRDYVLARKLIASARRSVYGKKTAYVLWSKARYLIGCHLCTGTWVAMVEAVFLSAFGRQWWQIVLSGLAYKAVGHLVLEVVALGRAKRESLSG